MHLKNRSFRETNVLQSLGAPRGPTNLPGPSDAPPGLQLHHQQPRNESSLSGSALIGIACRMQALGLELRGKTESGPTTIGIAPATESKKKFVQANSSLGTLPLESKLDSFPRDVPPSPQLDLVSAWACDHELSQLRAEIATSAGRDDATACWYKPSARRMADNNNNNNNNKNTDNNHNKQP